MPFARTPNCRRASVASRAALERSASAPGGQRRRASEDLRNQFWRSKRTRAKKLAAADDTGTITVFGLRRHDTEFDLNVYLRHNPGLGVDEQPPARLTMAVELIAGTYEPPRLVEAAVRFLGRCAERMHVLHGGVTRLDNIAQASCETTGGLRSEVDKQPDLFQRRREHDWRLNKRALWTRCRRPYWTTLLGPTLASAADGAEAARAAGALDVREVNGSLLFRAMEGPPRDSLDPEFLAATTSLRRWLWPHTFQNPLDAAGFEAEVGLSPTKSDGAPG